MYSKYKNYSGVLQVNCVLNSASLSTSLTRKAVELPPVAC